ncbi:TetR family transcriptional regulator [Streptomyces sp. OfavH-34-F]|uniref:TetR/AcrR family transcriptional regulator C-terminal domain-containing protein n=1 Tax=unclassified Streptomyces TaxID=2593676 RepID=UPI001EF25D2F|nr:TetR/AcrR family transcriptional regulator C-terminal domain-containing protein [Streptomyces sp. OfavH-34-F]MCG7527725.1 TetR family transcriptional regulator [Streptomyces sp. OfavH-34-F]
MEKKRTETGPPSARARDRGRATKRRLIEAAARLCEERPGTEVSVAEIASAAGAFPNQVTYYFGSKDSLLVHAAFLGLLHDTRRVERVGRQAPDAAAFRRNIARAVLAMPSLPSVARALATGIARPELAPVVDQHLQLLFRQSERFTGRLVEARGWRTGRPLAAEVRTFWSTALGAVLLVRAGAHGTSADLDLAGSLTLHDGPDPAGKA